MKGTVQQRWKSAEGGREDCKHEWGKQVKKAQDCKRCGARRVRSDTWTWQHDLQRRGRRAYVTGTAKLMADAQKALTESLAAHAKRVARRPDKDDYG